MSSWVSGCVTVDPAFRQFLVCSQSWKRIEAGLTFDMLRDEIRSALTKVDAACVAHRWLRPARDWARYALVAMADEVVLSRGDRIAVDWAQRPLQLDLFGEFTAGQGFFLRWDALQAADTVDVSLMRLYCLCVLYGFRGELAVQGDDALAARLRAAREYLAAHPVVWTSTEPMDQAPSASSSPVKWRDRWRRIFFRTRSADP